MNKHRFGRGADLALLAALALAMLALVACGNDDGHDGEPAATAGDISIYDPVIRYTLGTNAAMHFRVTSDGAGDRLVEVRTEVAGHAELHETVSQGATGVMRPVNGGLEVPADGELVLAPGGYHVMLMELERELEDGEVIAVELVFESAGSVSLDATVEALRVTNGDDHDGGESDDHSHE